MANEVDNAWKMYSSLIDWTGKVDSKASFAFALESAAFAVTVALSVSGRTLAGLTSAIGQVFYWVGVCGLLSSMALAMFAVIPRLTKAPRGAGTTNFLYFGHLRLLAPEDVVKSLQDAAIHTVIARHCIAMAEILWQKHRLIRFSLFSAGLSILFISIAGASTLQG